MSVYTKTARKSKSGKLYAFGRNDELDGHPTDEGGYLIFALCSNYDGAVRGGVRKSWRYTDKGLSYIDAIEKMNQKLGLKR